MPPVLFLKTITMKFTWISILVILLGLSHAVYSQTDSSSRLKGFGIPVAGDTMHINYVKTGGPLQQKENISALVYMFNDYKWAVDDILLKDGKGTYKLPENCAFVALLFYTGENGNVTASDNNNDYGYVATTVSKDGKHVPGGQLAWGIFRKPSFGKAPHYFDKFEISNDALEMWVRKEMKDYLPNMPKYFDSYLAMLKLQTGDEYPEKAVRSMERLSRDPNLTEENYMIFREVYRSQFKDEHKADSIKNVILEKFPHGQTARLARYTEAYIMPLDEKKLTALENFLHDFPVKDADGKQAFIYYNVYRELAAAYFASNQNDKLFAIIPDMNFATLNEDYRSSIDHIFVMNRLPVERLYPVSKVLIDAMIKKRHDLSYEEDVRYTPMQADEVARAQMDYKLSIHIRLLTKMGKYTEALPYLDLLTEKSKYADAALNEARITILQNTGGEKMILPVLEMGIRSDAATPAMISKLKELHGDSTGFYAYMESLKAVDDVKRTKEELKAKLINEKYTAFKLEDMNGKTVSSADWKDKIVVIDFWATWCFPCKMAFPGMQLAVDKYGKDPSVGFYFIATMEKSKTYKEDIKKYISTSGFRFQVLYDDHVFKSLTPFFHSSAIPRKIIVKNGYIRYTSEGYEGSPSKLADEISYVIEILKTEN
jgi:thiol-disulfide isomerase/thioredoxin